MGNKNSKLSAKTAKMAEDIFKKIDTDGSNTIDREETLNYWYDKEEIEFRQDQH